jgi:DNA-binding NarL/FixJ family response regulator
MIRIHLIEDHAIFRRSLVEELNALEGMRVVAEHSSMEAALVCLTESAPEDAADLFLIDIGLPGINGIEGMKSIHKQLPHARVMILTARQDKDSVKQALRGGADGYLLKTDDIAIVGTAIKDVMHGKAHLDPGISGAVLEAMQDVPEKGVDFGLAPQELVVVRLLADGLTKKMIADEMALSIHTVDGYLRSIYRKMDVHTVNGAVAKALKSGIV